MQQKKPTFILMVRAPFLSSILAPILAGSLLAVLISDAFDPTAFLLVLVLAVGLHIATNVYNDIYDTRQGTDRVNVHRNEFSGGSGVLLDFPELAGKMFSIARLSLAVALFAAIALTFRVDRVLWPYLWGLYLLSAFFSKYYTAAPVKLAYRGVGEVAVWFAFGPMAILVAAVSQNVGLRPEVVALMPATGISTLSILLIGELIDLNADIQGGKLGVAARRGTAFTRWLYLVVQLFLIIDMALLSTLILHRGWPLLLAIVPYILLFPRAWKIIHTHHADPDALKVAAGINVQIHLLFSLLLCAGLGLALLID